MLFALVPVFASNRGGEWRAREMFLESFKLDWVLVGNWWKILDDVEFPLRIVVNILGWMDKDISILCFKILF